MDPVSLVVAALVAGAVKSVGASAESAVSEAYQKLRGLVGRLFSGRQGGEVALAQHESAPEVWRGPLEAELRAAGVESDEAVIAAAQRLLQVADPEGAAEGKYRVVLSGSQGVQVGDRNTQTNTFTGPPPIP